MGAIDSRYKVNPTEDLVVFNYKFFYCLVKELFYGIFEKKEVCYGK